MEVPILIAFEIFLSKNDLDHLDPREFIYKETRKFFYAGVSDFLKAIDICSSEKLENFVHTVSSETKSWKYLNENAVTFQGFLGFLGQSTVPIEVDISNIDEMAHCLQGYIAGAKFAVFPYMKSQKFDCKYDKGTLQKIKEVISMELYQYFKFYKPSKKSKSE